MFFFYVLTTSRKYKDTVGGKELKWRKLAHNQLMSPQGPHYSPYSYSKTNLKAQISGKLVSSGKSDVAFTSVSLEKTRLKKLMITWFDTEGGNPGIPPPS